MRTNTESRRRTQSDVPGWVTNSLTTWGRQKRRAWFGGYGYRDVHGRARQHVDGHASTNLLARIQSERDGAGQGNMARQRWAEVYTGSGLQVQLALFGLPERPWFVLHLQYVLGDLAAVGERIALLGSSRTKYFHALSCGQTWVHARLEDDPRKPGSQVIADEISRLLILNSDAESGTDSQVFEQQGAQDLHPPGSAGRIRANSAEMAELSFRSLGRHVLSLRRR
jgi:hypothetical protein